jgi:hypothetical protein
MITLRTLGGAVTKLPPEVKFVEISSADGLLGAVVFVTGDGQVRITRPGDPDFDNYVRHHRLRPARLIKLPDEL